MPLVSFLLLCGCHARRCAIVAQRRAVRWGASLTKRARTGGRFVSTRWPEAQKPMRVQSIAPPWCARLLPSEIRPARPTSSTSPSPAPHPHTTILTCCTIKVLISTERSINLSRAILAVSVRSVGPWSGLSGAGDGGVVIAALERSGAVLCSFVEEAVDMVKKSTRELSK